MDIRGLSDAEVKKRVSEGKINSFESPVSRGYLDIIIKNVCTKYNLLLLILGCALIYFDEYISALSATGIIAINILISTVQEMRAKRRLDKIALLLRPTVKVIRDGKETEIDPSKIVLDDIVHMEAGDQAQVDGELVSTRSMEMDESLLTGESRSVRKHDGDTVYSGAFCITGEGFYKVTALGEETFASKMLLSARKYSKKRTPLQMETGAVTEMLMIIAFVYLIIMVLSNLVMDKAAVTALEEAVIILDIVPIALFLLITVTYMIAAVRMAKNKVLLQNSNSVESMSHVDTVCMDKTGTITTNNLIWESAEYFADEDAVNALIRKFAKSTGSVNRTVRAIVEKYGEEDADLIEEILFSSERKYSAVRIRTDRGSETIFMGAWSSLREHTGPAAEIDNIARARSSEGLRTVIFCTGGDLDLYKDGEPAVPRLTPLCLISISDEVRADCREILDGFMSNGMDIKVISGDDPETVNALFTIAKIPGERKMMSGDMLDSIPPEQLAAAVSETNIFGRMRPDQKEIVIESLKREGRYVTMVGDGVNDVRSLKAANVGVALQSGSGAARGVADMVLIDDDFRALPEAIIEGKKTVTGMRDILRLYLTRNFVLAILVGIMLLIFHRMPLLPVQNAYYALISVSFAAFLMAIWAKPSDNKDLILPDVLRFSIPTALLIALFGMITYVVFSVGTGSGYFDIPYDGMYESVKDMINWNSMQDMIDYLGAGGIADTAEINARNAMLMFLVLAGISQLFLIYPVFSFLSPTGKPSKQLKPAILAFLLFGLVALLYNVPQVAVGVACLVIFPMEYNLLIVLILIAWFFCTVIALRFLKMRLITDFVESAFDKKLKKEMEKNDQQDRDDTPRS